MPIRYFTVNGKVDKELFDIIMLERWEYFLYEPTVERRSAESFCKFFSNKYECVLTALSHDEYPYFDSIDMPDGMLAHLILKNNATKI